MSSYGIGNLTFCLRILAAEPYMYFEGFLLSLDIIIIMINNWALKNILKNKFTNIKIWRFAITLTPNKLIKNEDNITKKNTAIA